MPSAPVVPTYKGLIVQNGTQLNYGFEMNRIRGSLCDELTEQILDEMGERYKKQFGLKPTVASKLRGFSVLIGYMLSPFNVNFYKIAQH